jgi:hypothetical protein
LGGAPGADPETPSSYSTIRNRLGGDPETHCKSVQFDFPKLCAKYLMVLETPAPLGSANKINGLREKRQLILFASSTFLQLQIHGPLRSL